MEPSLLAHAEADRREDLYHNTAWHLACVKRKDERSSNVRVVIVVVCVCVCPTDYRTKKATIEGVLCVCACVYKRCV